MKLVRPIMLGLLPLLTVSAAPRDKDDELILYMNSAAAIAWEGAAAPQDEAAGQEIVVNGQRIRDPVGPFVTALINHVPMKLRVHFNQATVSIHVNGAAARRARLHTINIIHPTPCNPERQPADVAFTQVLIGNKPISTYVSWLKDRNIAQGDVDGAISPALLPQNRVTLRFHRPQPGERTIELPIDPGHFTHLGTYLRLGKERVLLEYAPHQPYSIATASAGAYLAKMQDGHWAGEPTSAKLPWMEGPRPARPMTLRKPINLNGLYIHDLLVRTADFRGKYQLPADDPDPNADPGEIVVSGKNIRADYCPHLELLLGRETFATCSSITHDKKRKMLTLQCL